MNAAGSSEPAAIESVPANAPVSPGAAESLTPGELLRRERERRSISLLQAAEDLHLDTRVVEAIEANRFDLLGAPVYARGHLKKYAALMGLSPEFVIERYQAQANQPEEPMPVPASVTTGVAVGFERRASFKGPLLVSVSLIVLALGWWIVDEITTPSYEPRQVPSLEPVQDEPAVTGDQVTTTTLTPMPAPPAAQSVVTSPAAPANVAPVRVRLEYSDASWTEIYDAAGKRLMFNLGEIGRVRTVSGTPPIRVTLGNASAVAVQVNERSVVVPRRAGRDSAKFVITADGEVQTMSDEVPVE
jgi:cytoskeleton protein RodZ